MLPFLLASLSHHRAYLRSHLPVNHPLFLQRVWTSGMLDRVADKVLTGIGEHPLSRLIATGIPPHIVLANEIAQLRIDMESKHALVVARIEALPENLKQSLLDNFRVDGVVPITASQIEAKLQSMMAAMMELLRNQQVEYEASLSRLMGSAENGHQGLTQDVPNSQFLQFYWRGRFHPVPEDFRFPT